MLLPVTANKETAFTMMKAKGHSMNLLNILHTKKVQKSADEINALLMQALMNKKGK